MFNSQYLGEMGIPKKEPEPTMEFSKNGTEILRLTSREIRYNHSEFPNDTAKQAAQRIFPMIRGTMLHGLTKDKPVTIRLRAYEDQPEREITFAVHGIEHNYVINTWTWWMLHNLEELIAKNF